METIFERSELLMGKEAGQTLQNKRVLIVGVGGVGSFCAEALVRSGIGHLILVDFDDIRPSNLNRQLMATTKTIGRKKVDVLKKRMLEINPDCHIETHDVPYRKEMNDTLFGQRVDYCLDAIDSIAAKKELIQACLDNEVPFLSSMGMARRNDPAKLVVTELEKTSYDPLAKILRQWKRKERIRKKIRVVASTEAPMNQPEGQPLPSMIFVPGSAGLLMASVCLQDLIQEEKL